MKCSPELLEIIQQAIESTPYGSVHISLSEKGTFVEITTERKERLEKPPEDYHRG